MVRELKVHSIGGTVGEGFNLYFKNFFPLLFLSAVIGLPSYLYRLYFIAGRAPNEVILFTLGLSLINLTMGTIASGFFIQYVSSNYIQDSSFNISTFFKKGFQILFPLIILSILNVIFISFAFMVLIIPGIIVSLGLSVAPHVLVIERTRIMDAFSRSWKLTEGKKWDVFLIMFLGGIIMMLITMASTIISGVVDISDYLKFSIEFISSTISTPVFVCIMVVVYFNLRIEKEGFNVEHLTSQFNIEG